MTQGIWQEKIGLLSKKLLELYNNESCNPTSYQFKEFNYGLAEHVVLSLPLQKDDCQLTVEKVKISFGNAKSDLNDAINNWKKQQRGGQQK